MTAVTADPGRMDLMMSTNEALQSAWAAIQGRSPGVPDALVIRGERDSACRGVDWSALQPVLTVGQQTVAEGAEPTLAFLLHQAGHALTPDTGLGTGSHGRQHVAAYRAQATQLGLTLSGTAHAITTLSDDGRKRYADVLRALRPVVAAEAKRVGPPETGRNRLAVQCQCPQPRKLWVSRSTLDLGPVTCGVCGAKFQP